VLLNGWFVSGFFGGFMSVGPTGAIDGFGAGGPLGFDPGAGTGPGAIMGGGGSGARPMMKAQRWWYSGSAVAGVPGGNPNFCA
jgi:hypothetical protein